jgi:peptidoglycan/LPS O-acetylase OafA/YrhL
MMQRQATQPFDRAAAKIAELDAARAISIAFVLLVHVSYGRVPGGFLGVDVFFVLSGYLITMLLIREYERFGRIDLRAFYMRRVLRIVPALVTATALAIVLEWASLTPEQAAWRVAAVLLFWANFPGPEYMGNLAHTWSLAVEEQFYLVWPALLIVCLRSGRRAAGFVAGAIIIGAVATRYWMVSHLADLNVVYTFTLSRVDGIMLGCLMAILEPQLRDFLANAGPRIVSAIAWGSLASLLCLLLLAQRSFMQGEPTAFLAFALIAASFILTSQLLAASSPLKTALGFSAVQWLGQRSYGLYLYHYPIFLALEPWRVPGDLLNFVLVASVKVTVSLMFTEVAWRCIEQPIQRLRRHFAPEGKLSAV